MTEAVNGMSENMNPDSLPMRRLRAMFFSKGAQAFLDAYTKGSVSPREAIRAIFDPKSEFTTLAGECLTAQDLPAIAKRMEGEWTIEIWYQHYDFWRKHCYDWWLSGWINGAQCALGHHPFGCAGIDPELLKKPVS